MILADMYLAVLLELGRAWITLGCIHSQPRTSQEGVCGSGLVEEKEVYVQFLVQDTLLGRGNNSALVAFRTRDMVSVLYLGIRCIYFWHWTWRPRLWAMCLRVFCSCSFGPEPSLHAPVLYPFRSLTHSCHNIVWVLSLRDYFVELGMWETDKNHCSLELHLNRERQK